MHINEQITVKIQTWVNDVLQEAPLEIACQRQRVIIDLSAPKAQGLGGMLNLQVDWVKASPEVANSYHIQPHLVYGEIDMGMMLELIHVAFYYVGLLNEKAKANDR